MSITQRHDPHTSLEQRPSNIRFVFLFQEPKSDLCEWIHPPCWPYCLGGRTHPMKKESLQSHKDIMWTTVLCD